MDKNRPTCFRCKRKMKKNGTTKKGTIRWRCGTCNISETKRRTDNTNAKWFRLFYSHITGKSTREDIAKQAGVCLATVDKKFKTMWFIQVPHIPDNHTVHDQVFIDGTHLGGGCLLIASTLTHVLNWHWCKGETTKDYMELLRPLAPPLIVTLDGGQGARTAIRRLWPETKINDASSTQSATSDNRHPATRRPYKAKKYSPSPKNSPPSPSAADLEGSASLYQLSESAQCMVPV